MFDLKKFIKKSFWFFSLPFLGLVSLYYGIQHQNPIDTLWFVLAISLCMPMIILRTDELQKTAFENLLDEFRNMTQSEFFECEYEILNMPSNKNSLMMKEAYKQISREKYGREL